MKFLRDQVSVVLQKNVLFSGTILDNLRWGNENATEEECIEACKWACADEFIERFPDKYNTVIERGGTNVSGGQKQRVAIVRALCMHPEILLFDEVTAALDPEMVREVLDVMLDLAKQGRTMLIVTHEMQFARAIADRIIFLDNGKIVEEATPDEFFDNPKTERAKQFLNTFEFDSVRAKKELTE